MSWTSSLPKSTGWYWYRERDVAPRVVWINNDPDTKTLGAYDPLIEDAGLDKDTFPGDWFGPLTPPA